MSNSREVNFPFVRSVELVVVRAPEVVGGLAVCAELSVPLKPVDLGIPSELCKIAVFNGWWCGILSW